MAPNTHYSLFFYIFSALTRELLVIHENSVYQTTTLLFKIPIFWVRAACKLWLVSYGFKSALQSVSDKPFVRMYTQLENHLSHMDFLHIKQLLYCQRYSLHGLELDERSDWEIWTPDTHQSFNIVCIYCKPIHVHTLLFGTHLCATTKLTYLMTAYMY